MEAAAGLYPSLRPTIEAALQRVLQDRPADFEDLMQVTYERVVRTIVQGTFKGRSQLRTWASSIAAHVAVDYLRRCSHERKLYRTMDLRFANIPTETRTERQLEARSELYKVRGVLQRMKPRRARILVLHDMYGYSVPQVAEHLGMHIKAVQSTLFRARQEFARRCTTSRPSVH